MPPTKDKLQKPATKRGSRARKRHDKRTGSEKFFDTDTPMLPDSLRWVLLIAGVVMIFGALFGWPFPINPGQALFGIGGALLVIFAFFGVRRTVGNILKVFAWMGL